MGNAAGNSPPRMAPSHGSVGPSLQTGVYGAGLGGGACSFSPGVSTVPVGDAVGPVFGPFGETQGLGHLNTQGERSQFNWGHQHGGFDMRAQAGIDMRIPPFNPAMHPAPLPSPHPGFGAPPLSPFGCAGPAIDFSLAPSPLGSAFMRGPPPGPFEQPRPYGPGVF